MKRITALFLAAVLLCGVLTACVPGNTGETDDTTASTTLPQEEATQTIPVEVLPDPTSPIASAPEVPIETIPQMPEADYSLPPGEIPGSNPVNQ